MANIKISDLPLFAELTLDEKEIISGGWGWPSWKQVRAFGVTTAIVGGVISVVPGGKVIGAPIAAAGGIIYAGGVAGETADDALS